MDLTIQQLRYFVAVAEELHFSRAAQRLHVAAPSLSQQIAALERRLGTALFHRTSRHVELTAAGAELLPRARRVMASTDEVLAWAERRRGAGGSLRLGVVVSSPIQSAILTEAARSLPDVRWEIRHLGLIEALDDVRSGDVDVIMLPEVDPPLLRSVHAVPLWSEGRVLAVATTHRLARRAAVGIDETNDETFFAFESDEARRKRWFVAPRRGGAVPRVEIVRRNLDVLDMCSAGLGVGIAGTASSLSSARPELAYVPIRDVPDATTYLLRAADIEAGTVQAFERLAVRVARQVAQRYGARPPSDPQPAGARGA